MKKNKTQIYQDFCKVNSLYWPKKTSTKPQKILVEGFFAEAGPNYVVRVGSITKTIEEILDCDSLVLLQNGVKKEEDKVEIWQSFAINNFIGLREDIFRKFSKLKKIGIAALAFAYYVFAKILFLIKKEEILLNLKFAGVEIGDLIYDEIVKQNEFIKDSKKKEYKISQIKSCHKEVFKRTFFYLFSSIAIYKKYRSLVYVTTHSQYINYGIPTRYFASKGMIIAETTDDILFIHDESRAPKFHTAIKKIIQNKLADVLKDEEKQKLIQEKLEKRFSGKEEQIDVKLAYADKKIYSAQELKNELKITNDNPFVFIFAHVFADAPRGLSDNMLFKDYYDWLLETIKFINKINHINWIIKPHPSSKAYGEVGMVEDMLKKIKTVQSSIYICPENFSTASVGNCAKTIVTVQGTVGIEFACLGIPTVLAGQPFYSGFNFTHEPLNRSDYYNCLQEIEKINPLTKEQVRTARAVYAIFSDIFNKDFSLIDSKIKDMVWGCGREVDILGAFELMSERLKKTNPSQIYFCQQIKEYFAKKNA